MSIKTKKSLSQWVEMYNPADAAAIRSARTGSSTYRPSRVIKPMRKPVCPDPVIVHKGLC